MSSIEFLLVAIANVAGAGCLPSAPPPQNNAVYFDPDIQATMDVVGCASNGCHGDNDTPMRVVPPAQGGNVDTNYREVLPRTKGADQSLFLTKPVMGAPVDHEGGKLLPRDGTTYAQWLAWIQAGAPLRAPGSSGTPAPPSNNAPDGGAPPADGGTPTMPPANSCVPAQVTLKQSHYAGQECLFCHATGQNALLRWTVAGTLWQDPFGTSIKGGATVTLVDATGQSVSMITDCEGNFYTARVLTFPVTVSASSCPNTKPMVAKVTNGSCNSLNCHDTARPAFLP